MALLFMDGFDANDITAKWNNVSGTWSTTSSTRFGYGAASTSGGTSSLTYKSFPAANKVYAGFAVNTSNLNSRIPISLYGDGGTINHLTLVTNTDGSLTLRRGGATNILSSTAGILSVNTWYYMEISATIADAGGTATIKVNGAVVISYTGDTKNAGVNSTIDAVSIGSSPSITYDDLYICDDTGTAPYNTFLGEIRVYSLSPNGAGSSTQFTPSSGANYTTVDELPYSASDYVSSATTGQRDTYAMADLPATTGTILAVQNNVIAKKTDASAISLKPALKSGSTVYYGSTVSLAGFDSTLTDLHTTDPATTAAWTNSGVNALEGGFEVA